MDYLIHKTISILSAMKLNDNRVDRQKWADMEERHAARAEQIRRSKRWQLPEITRWSEVDRLGSSIDDPMGWRS